MTKGYSIGNGVFQVWDGDRVTFTTDGRLVNFLTSESEYGFNAAYPDAIKGRISMWSYNMQYNSLVTPPYSTQCWGIAAVGATSQEWSQIIDLGPVPSGANIFLGKAKIFRTLAPTHPWIGQTLDAPPFNDLWIPVNGSLMMEQALGISRALSIYIADGSVSNPGPAGRLVAFVQQSVSSKCGGFRQWGTQLITAGQSSTGGENIWHGSGSGPALPLFFPAGTPGRKISQGSGGFSGGDTSAASIAGRHKWNGADPPTYSDPTNYSSTYAVQLVGRFGRHA